MAHKGTLKRSFGAAAAISKSISLDHCFAQKVGLLVTQSEQISPWTF
jgi:hypothetical protein